MLQKDLQMPCGSEPVVFQLRLLAVPTTGNSAASSAMLLALRTVGTAQQLSGAKNPGCAHRDEIDMQTGTDLEDLRGCVAHEGEVAQGGGQAGAAPHWTPIHQLPLPTLNRPAQNTYAIATQRKMLVVVIRWW